MVSHNTVNLNMDSMLTSTVDCPSVEAFSKSFASPVHLLNPNLIFRNQKQEDLHNHRDSLDAIVPSTVFSDQSSISRRSSASAISFDDITLHESDLDDSFDEDEDSDANQSISKHNFAQSRSSNLRSNKSSPTDQMQTERRHRYGRKGSESNARYRLECIRERNRVAARKYRQKQKERSSRLEVQGERLIEERDELVQAVKRLQDEVFVLKHRYLNQLCWNCGQASS